MSIDKFINHIINSGGDPNIELEARFGSYNKLSSNIRQTTFFKVYDTFKSDKKKYSFIRDIIYTGDIKRRSVLDDNKSLVQNLFQTPVYDNINNNVMIYSNMINEKNTITLNKIQIFKPIEIKGVVKISINKENITNNVISDKPKFHRNKFRCSIQLQSWVIDLTILLILDCSTDRYSIFYEIEVEFHQEQSCTHAPRWKFIKRPVSVLSFFLPSLVRVCGATPIDNPST